jgi:hypothetical protein
MIVFTFRTLTAVVVSTENDSDSSDIILFRNNLGLYGILLEQRALLKSQELAGFQFWTKKIDGICILGL